MTRSFTVAVESAAEPDEGAEEPYEFTFSDDPERTLTVFPPTEGQIMTIMAMAGRDLGMSEAAKVQRMMLQMFDESSRQYVEDRLESRENPLKLSSLFEVFTKIVEAEAGRPTTSSPDSGGSRATSGKRSTGPARRAASTRSRSGSTGSATSSTPGTSNGSVTEKSSSGS